MVCNVAIQYPHQLSIADFREEVEKPLCLKAARFVVHQLKSDIDKELVGVKEKFKKFVFYQLVCELQHQLEIKVEEQVVPKILKTEPFSTWLDRLVMLDVTDEHSLLQFIVNAELDTDEDSTNSWKNVSVEIKTVVMSQPEKVG